MVRETTAVSLTLEPLAADSRPVGGHQEEKTAYDRLLRCMVLLSNRPKAETCVERFKKEPKILCYFSK
jgi:hypothetical protein